MRICPFIRLFLYFCYKHSLTHTLRRLQLCEDEQCSWLRLHSVQQNLSAAFLPMPRGRSWQKPAAKRGPAHGSGSDLPEFSPVALLGLPAPAAALGAGRLAHQVVQAHAHGSSQEEESPAPPESVPNAVPMAADVSVYLNGDWEHH